MKALIERLKIDWAGEKRRMFEDRAINGLNDGYTIEQAGRLCALLLRGGIDDGDGRQRVTGADLNLLRTRLDFLMLHAMMLRGESTRKAELADLCNILPDESSECLGLVLRTNAGKAISASDLCHAPISRLFSLAAFIENARRTEEFLKRRD